MVLKADLHTHTTCSDGTCSPDQLLHLAKQAGLDLLSITDHDTVKAYELLKPTGKLIAGVELSASYQGYSVHLLAYSFALQHPLIKALCADQVARREKRNLEILSRLETMGCRIHPDELQFTPADQMGSVGRPHIARVMVNKGFVGSIREAFDRYIGEEGPAFVAGARCSVEEAIETIHAAKGFVVIAHPHYIKDKNILRQLLKCPFDGLEAYYAHFTHDHLPYWLGLAQEHGLFATGGSDFHGEAKPAHYLGASCTPDPTLQLLLERSLANNGPL